MTRAIANPGESILRSVDTMIHRDEDPEEWTYDPKARRYRSKRTGRFLSHDSVVAARDRYIVSRNNTTSDLVADVYRRMDDVAIGGLAWASLVDEMSRIGWYEVESTFITEYVYGKGGIHNMTAADYARLGSMMTVQRRYWDGFMADIESGKLNTEAGIRSRMQMYNGSARSFHSRGLSAAWDIDLPTYPGEQSCLSNCRCSWRIVERKDRIEAYWERGGSENSCTDCIDNARQYNPYVIEREGDGTA